MGACLARTLPRHCRVRDLMHPAHMRATGPDDPGAFRKDLTWVGKTGSPDGQDPR